VKAHRLLIVCCRLKDGTAEDYGAVLSRINETGPCQQLGETTYAVLTDIEPEHLSAVVALASPAVNRVYIGTLAAPAKWFGFSEEASWWLEQVTSQLGVTNMSQ
jgi:hypothetical protein